MTNRPRNPIQVLREARVIASEHGMHVIEQRTHRGAQYALYRGLPELDNLVGVSATECGIRDLVCDCTGFR